MKTLTIAIAAFLAAALGQEPTDVTESTCKGEVALAATQHVVIKGRCSTRGAERVLAISIRNTAPAESGTLNTVWLGFCGSPIIRARAPKGWATTLDKDHGGVKWWRGGRDFDEPGIPAGAEIAGFEIILRPGWRRSPGAEALWESSDESTVGIHDC